MNDQRDGRKFAPKQKRVSCSKPRHEPPNPAAAWKGAPQPAPSGTGAAGEILLPLNESILADEPALVNLRTAARRQAADEKLQRRLAARAAQRAAQAAAEVAASAPDEPDAAERARAALAALCAPDSGDSAPPTIDELERDLQIALGHEGRFQLSISTATDPWHDFPMPVGTTFRDLAEDILALEDAQGDGLFGVFCNLNPIKADFKGTSARNQDIHHRANILIDCDPKRPKGSSATDAERAAALEVALGVMTWLGNEHGWPCPVVACSGNGIHLIYRTEEIGIGTGREGYAEEVVQGLHELYSTPEVIIDRSVTDFRRLIRLPGILNRKSPGSPDRPQRLACILFAPQGGPQPVPGEALRKAAQALTSETKRREQSSAKRREPIVIDDDDPEFRNTHERAKLAIAFIAASAPDIADGYQDWIAVGMSLRDLGDEHGLALFHEFSKLSHKYSFRQVEEKWKSWRERPRGGITIATLFQYANGCGFRDWFDEYRDAQHYKPVSLTRRIRPGRVNKSLKQPRRGW